METLYVFDYDFENCEVIYAREDFEEVADDENE